MVYEASWHGIFAPAGTPRPIIHDVQTEFARRCSPETQQILEAGGHVPIGSTPEEFRKFVDDYLKDTAEQLRIAKVETAVILIQ